MCYLTEAGISALGVFVMLNKAGISALGGKRVKHLYVQTSSSATILNIYTATWAYLGGSGFKPRSESIPVLKKA